LAKDLESKKIIGILNSCSFYAERIPESTQEGKRADIAAWKGEDHYIIEVKTKDDHPDLMDEIEKGNDLEIIEYKKELFRSNTLSGIIHDAVDQLIETPDNNYSFKIIWFRAVESLIVDILSFLKSTIYGIRYLLIRDSMNKFYHVECYYFDFNDFFKYTMLDGIILDDGVKLELCTNSFSSRLPEFQNSTLYQLFAERNKLIDPLQLEKEGRIFVADTQISRKNENDIKNFIESKYNVHVQILQMNVLGGVVTYGNSQ